MLTRTVFNRPFDVAREMDRLFETMVSTHPRVRLPEWQGEFSAPSLNVWEDDKAMYAEAELPGMKLEDLNVSVAGSELTVSGRRDFSKSDDAQWIRRERAVGSFSRTIDLPYEVDVENVEATLRDGVLSIVLPKAETYQPKRIEVKS